jgi:hypothetical protein
VEFDWVNLTVGELHPAHSLEFAPATTTELFFESVQFTNGEVNGDGFNICDVTNQLKVIVHKSASIAVSSAWISRAAGEMCMVGLGLGRVIADLWSEALGEGMSAEGQMAKDSKLREPLMMEALK